MIAASLMLGVVHLSVWQKQRTQYANLLFFVLAVSAAAYGAYELARLHAETPADFASNARWSHVPLAAFVIAIVGFVRLYFNTGRLWLAYAVIGLRLAAPRAEFPDGRQRQFPGNYRTGPICSSLEARSSPGPSAAGIRGQSSPAQQPPAHRVHRRCLRQPLAQGRHRGAPPRCARGWQSCSMRHDGCRRRRTDRHRTGTRAHRPHARLLHRRPGDGLRAGLGPDCCGAACGAAPGKRRALPHGRRSGSERDAVGRRQGHDYARQCTGREPVRLSARGTHRDAGRNADSGALSLAQSGQPGACAGNPWARARAAGRELFARRKDGGETPVEAALSPMPTEQGVFVLVSVVDVTERLRVERATARQRDELAHLSRVAMLGELSGSLAHELNQPLTAILSNAQAAQRFLAQSPPRYDRLPEILADIVKSDHRAGAVIQRLRSLLKKEESQRHPLDINELVEESLRLMRSDLLSRQVAVGIDLATALPVVSGDRNQLQQVLLNLVINGCDAMDGEETDRRLLVRTPDDRRRQCGSRRHRQGRGNTLGESRAHFRALCDHQVDRHGFGPGDLPIDRRGAWRPSLGNQQCGLRCYAALRVAGQEGLTSMRESAPTVYVVDDDPDVLKAIERLLESTG